MTDGTGIRSRAGERGFTLVELMVAVLVIAVGLLALTLTQTRYFKDIYGTGMHTRALEIAQTQVETARSAGFTLAQSDSGVTGGFTWRCDVDSVDMYLRRVSSTVSWTEKGQTRSVQLMDLLSSR